MSADFLDRIPLRVVSDLGGLPVADAGGRPIGRVFGGLAEADTGLLRYLDVSVDDLNRHILVPIGHVRIRQQNGEADVRLRAAVLADLLNIPTFEPEGPPVDDPYERDVLAAYGRAFYGDRYYAHPAFDHGGIYAGDHPIVYEPEDAVPAAPPERSRLLPLAAAKNYRLSKGEPDIRGWSLMTDADQPSGEISDLLVDLEEQQVRYVLVDVADGHGIVPLPIGFLILDERKQRVRAPGLRHDDLAALPRLEGTVTRRVEDAVRDVLRGRMIERRRYALPDFGAGRLTDRRRA